MNEYKVFVQRIGLVGIANILVALSSLILIPIMTKSFSVSDYGIWVQITTTITLISNFAILGLHNSMIRFLSSEKDKEGIQEGFYSISTIVLASNIIISTLMFLFSKNIADALFNGNVDLAMLLSVIVFFAGLNVLLINYFRTFQQMKRFSIFFIFQTYLGIFIVSYFAISGYGIFITVSGLLISNLAIFLIMISFIILNIGFKLPKLKNLREYLSFGLPTVPAYLSYWTVDSSDRYIIGILLGTAFVGYYNPGYTLGSIIALIYAPFAFLLPSILPKYYDENNIKKVRIFLEYSLKYFLLFAIPAAFGLSVLSKQVLIILTTTAIASNGYLITPFVALSSLLFGISGIINNLIILKKKTKIMGMIWIIAAILNLGLNIILIPYLGIIGAAVTTLLTYSIAFILTIFYLTKIFKFDFELIYILKSVTSSVIMSTIIFLIYPKGILNISITIILAIIIYIFLMFIMKGIDKKEIEIIREIFLN